MSRSRPVAIVTRPREDSAAVAEALAAAGYVPLLEPMLSIRPRPSPLPDPKGLQALLFTSANGLRALVAQTGPELGPWLDVQALCVGDSSAALARQSGFKQVASADGDVGDLVALAVRECRPEIGTLLHLSGSDIAGNLAAALGRHGFTTDRRVLYSAEAADAFSPDLHDAVARDQVTLALFFSPRAAESFVTLARAEGLADRFTAVSAGALSPAVAKALSGMGWKNVLVSQRPRIDALLAAALGV
jgi:uroporphyrinogen-III synthase